MLLSTIISGCLKMRHIIFSTVKSIFFVFILLCSWRWSVNAHIIKHNHVDITLVGGYGDLAKKYLWRSIFNLYSDKELAESWTFNVFGGATKNASVGSDLLKRAMQTGLSCSSNNHAFHCQSFIEKVHYVQLKHEKDYAKHCSEVFSAALQSHCHKNHPCDYQHIIYLSVPPFTYKSISSYIAAHCRPVNKTGSLKVVFEKPFGHSIQSVTDLATSISTYLHEDEIYRVDHYLGKQTIQSILPFREKNQAINQLFCRQYVDKIEVVMKEKLSVKGRIRFYDKYGVMADVMQNHLSEVLYLLTMGLPRNTQNSDEINSKKLELLKKINTLVAKDVLLGQYKDYHKEMIEEVTDQNIISTTPTFAASRLRISSPRWSDVPVIITAGKMMDERTGYARVVFKESSFSLSKERNCPHRQEIIFHIGHGVLGKPAILISRTLPLGKDYVPEQWIELTNHTNTVNFHLSLSCYRVFTPAVQYDAYEYLMRQVFLGRQENFITLPALLESWRVWGPVIESSRPDLRIYPGGEENDNLLDFSYAKNMKFLREARSEDLTQFLGNKAVFSSTSTSLSSTLAQKIIASMRRVVETGRDFHIAFSGGSAPLELFDLLSAYLYDIPWENVHIWQVDERCTLNSSLSNFDSLSTKLIDKLPALKYKHIHPMPIETSADTLCNGDGAEIYEKWLKRYLGAFPKLDYVILGMGSDGHTASLFPSHSLLKEEEKLVAVADNVSHAEVKQRMTLTFPLINLSGEVAVLVGGNSKCDTLHKLQIEHCKSKELYPICHLSKRTLTWYIDGSCKALLRS